MDEGSLSLPILVVVAFVAILAGVTILAIRIYRNHRRENVTEEDIRTMVSEGQEQGVGQTQNEGQVQGYEAVCCFLSFHPLSPWAWQGPTVRSTRSRLFLPICSCFGKNACGTDAD